MNDVNDTDTRPTRDGGEAEASWHEPATSTEDLTGLGDAPTAPTTGTAPRSGSRPPVVRRVGPFGLVAEAASALTTLRQLDPGVSEVDRVNQALIVWEALELWRASGYRFTIEHPCGAVRDVSWTTPADPVSGSVSVRGVDPAGPADSGYRTWSVWRGWWVLPVGVLAGVGGGAAGWAGARAVDAVAVMPVAITIAAYAALIATVCAFIASWAAGTGARTSHAEAARAGSARVSASGQGDNDTHLSS